MSTTDSDSFAKLCDVCSRLNVNRLSHPLFPCRNSLSCSTPPIDGYLGAELDLGCVEEIDHRRSSCDLCKLIAESLDKESSDLGGKCRIRESAQFCSFTLPRYIKLHDPSVTHFHLTQVSVIFDMATENRFFGPCLPWEVKVADERRSHYVLHLQTRAKLLPKIGEEMEVSATPRTEQEFLETIGGRYVGTQINAEVIQAWLHECECKHGKVCMPSLQLPVVRDKSPTFVVDVIESRLVDTPSQCRYIALSYVWGTAPVFKHVLENTQHLRKIGSLRSLPIPATIRDAISLVHAIGERYLWVDSICIIQDDLQMQQREIMQMGSIYWNALFTIVAAAGDHANSGLPGVKLGSREEVQKILRLANCELLTVIDTVSGAPSRIGGTVWAQRGWTFQERVLSTRVLVFSENQVYWSCRAASHSEERSLEEVDNIDLLHLTFPQAQDAATDYISWESLEPTEYCNFYDQLLIAYRQRSLTYQTDILNAFNGVTEILAAIQKDTFFWGLPGSHFSYAMTWDMAGYCSRNHVEVPIFESNSPGSSSPKMTPIPSWSWAAWSGKDSPHCQDLIDGERQIVQPIIQFNIVDNRRQLVKIKERPWQDHQDPGYQTCASWQSAPPPQLQSLSPHSLPRIGQLHFWTCVANVRAVRRWLLDRRKLDYTLFPLPDVEPDMRNVHESPEIVYQDFIVIAARGVGAKLIVLAVEWKDGVAYRLGKTEVKEAEWNQVKNKQWRWITLG